MSIVWAEEDENQIKGLQKLLDEGYPLLISKNLKEVTVRFKIYDHLKANSFLMDLYHSATNDDEEMRNITGVELQEVRFVDDPEVREALAHVKIAQQILEKRMKPDRV